MHLPDINFWLALTFQVHAHHRTAAVWFEQQEPDSCAFCRFTQQGFLRLTTNPTVFADDTLTMRRAWTCYDLLLSDERVLFHPEPAEVDKHWRRYTLTRKRSPKIWSDAYLAAFATTASLQVVTFDRGFSAYKGCHSLILS